MVQIIDPKYKVADYQAQVMRRRRAKSRRFQAMGIAALAAAGLMLAALLSSIFYNGVQGLFEERMTVEVTFDPAKIDPKGTGDLAVMRKFNFDTLVYPVLYEALDIKVKGRSDRDKRRKVKQLIGLGASNQLRTMIVQEVGRDPVSDEPVLVSGGTQLGDTVTVELTALSTASNPYAQPLRDLGILKTRFNGDFFTGVNSNDPGYYGILDALVGSFWTLLVCFLASFPVAVLAAVYLEEFAPRNAITDFIEVNINNLAAVPSIVFGLMGAFVFIYVFGMPGGTALVGGLVLSLLTLPTIIVAARAAIRSVPGSFREAALGLGASRQQAMWSFVLPYAMPGIITGTIIGLAGALGETAPLLFIGMVGFQSGVPATPLEGTPSLAVGIYNAFGCQFDELKNQLSNSTIIVLLFLLMLLNGTAAYLRYRSEKSK